MSPRDTLRIRADALFAKALELTGDRQTAFLERIDDDPPSVRAVVQELLRLAAEPAPGLAPDALKGSPLWQDAMHGPGAGDPLLAGFRIGAWRLVAELGQGGMGMVWLAERADGQYRQKAALKFLPPGPHAESTIDRFERERQILASLNHPHIARLLDGGLTEGGRPWFAMEYVAGEPVDTFCDTRALNIDARLRLFVQLARAVHAAHGSLVVHRDLKPSNILVTAEGYPLLLDFGIAKSLDMTGDTESTANTHVVLTPEYASPEQVNGEAPTIASDIYQLGLLLHDLLTGRRAQKLAYNSPAELQYVVCERMPPLLSAAVLRGGDAESIARARGTDARRLSRKLRGDLNAVASKALRKTPERRYGSVAELVADIERYLRGLPVRARPETLRYRAGKFARRHPFGVAAGAAFCLLLVAYATTITWQAGRLAEERNRARTEARRTEEVKNFLVDLFEVSDPSRSRGADISARDLLDRGSERIREELADEPSVQSELMAIIGDIYRRLALYDRAAPLLDEALEMRRRLHGETHPTVAASLHARAELDVDQGDYQIAETRLRAALAMRRDALGPEHPLVAATLTALLVPLRAQNRHAEAEPLAEEALRIYRANYPDDDARIAAALNNLAIFAHRHADHDTAEPLYREAFEIEIARYGEVHAQTASTLHNLATLAFRRGRYSEAETLYHRVLDIERQLYPEGHPETAATLGYLGHMLKERGELAAAEGYYREAVTLLERTLPAGHPNTAGALGALGTLLMERGRAAEAEPLLRRSYEGRRDAFGPDHAKTLETRMSLGACLIALGRTDEGLLEIREVAERAATALGEDHDLSARARALLVRK